MSSFAKLKKEAWKYYRTWIQEKTYSRALKKEVIISKKCWDHITKGSSTRRRTAKAQVHRLTLLKPAKHIIKTTEKYRLENRDGRSYYILEKYVSKRRTVRVVIVKNSEEKFVLHSIMSH